AGAPARSRADALAEGLEVVISRGRSDGVGRQPRRAQRAGRAVLQPARPRLGVLRRQPPEGVIHVTPCGRPWTCASPAPAGRCPLFCPLFWKLGGKSIPTGYSLAGWSPPEPASASPAGSHYALQSFCRSRRFQRT